MTAVEYLLTCQTINWGKKERAVDQDAFALIANLEWD